MFFQLAQIDKLSNTVNDLSKARQKLQTFVIDAYQSEPNVKNSLNMTIADILDHGSKRCELFSKVEEDAMHGFLVPSYIDFDQFQKDKGELPEWTRVVFEKEFEKQKQSLDVMAKKIYSTHSLTQAKDKHQRQLNSFKLISDRYKVLSEYDQTIDIMNEAEKMKNLTKMVSDKFMAYLKVIASKLVCFIDQMTLKCQHFGQDLSSIASKSANTILYQEKQPPPPQFSRTSYEQKAHYCGSTPKATGQNWLTRANRTLDGSFRGNPQNYLLRQPRWLNTYTSDYYL